MALKLKSNLFELKEGGDRKQDKTFYSLKHWQDQAPTIHTNLSIDTLWIQSKHDLRHLTSQRGLVARRAEIKQLALSYGHWIRQWGKMRDWHEMGILKLNLEELLLVVDYDQNIDVGKAEIVDLDERTCFPRRFLADDGKRFSSEGEQRGYCKTWEELAELEVCFSCGFFLIFNERRFTTYERATSQEMFFLECAVY